jgi:hypothetical protein
MAGSPALAPDHIDKFPRFDSVPADFVPLDSVLPYQEGKLLWR